MWPLYQRNKALRWALVGLLAIVSWPTAADVFSAAQYSLMPEDDTDDTYVFTALVPEDAVTTRQPSWPPGCTQTSFDQRPRESSMLYSYTIECHDGFAADAQIYAPWRVDGARFSALIDQRRVERSFAGAVTGMVLPVGALTAPPKSLIRTAGYFTWQGMVHIWIGWDHLAFVLCLCLLRQGRALVGFITAFTVGHSISLALSFFNVVSIAIAPVEAVIALSIAVMAREAVLALRGRSTDMKHFQFAVIVTLFGLIHGLGFASALEGLGVAANARVPALIFFNMGVEIGQLVFVGALLVAFNALTFVALNQRAKLAAAWAAGTLGAFWTIERVAGFESLTL